MAGDIGDGGSLSWGFVLGVVPGGCDGEEGAAAAKEVSAGVGGWVDVWAGEGGWRETDKTDGRTEGGREWLWVWAWGRGCAWRDVECKM